MSTETYIEVGYGNDFTPDTLNDLYKTIEERRANGLPLFGVAVLIENQEGEIYPRRIGLRINHEGGVIEHEHTEYEE